jgi:hypothetical protein
MSVVDKPGSFYLGRPYDLAKSQVGNEPLLYDSKDLTTHAVCVGMTGSGKTGLCLALLEEAALNGIPAIAIDPKGDLGNLLLAFPNLQASDFRPWIESDEAAREKVSPDDFAASQAKLWKDGLAKWGQGPDRIRRYCDATERVIYTPGSSTGIPITVLKSFAAPPKELIDDGEAFRDRIASAASGLLALLGIDADPVRSREHILLSNLLETSWQNGRDLDLQQLIRQIQQPPFGKIGAVDLESFFPAAQRTKLSMSLNNLLASPSFAGWLEGESLDIGKILYTPAGKPRLAVISIAHLEDAQRMFFVTILLNEILAWIRTQSGTSNLRALLYMDEVFGYFPPLGNPPSKRPMLTLLKQARAFGLGCMLATQNPVDLDYKGLSNAGTWFLGRLQTERDKARVLEGLEGASAEAGSTFNRRDMEAKLAALGNRVFLMNNVHSNKPIVFQSRWAMSYLRGPLTRDQVKSLMDPLRKEFASSATGSDRVAASEGPNTESAATASHSAHAASPSKGSSGMAGSSNRPILPAAIREQFASVSERVPDGYQLQYRPGLLGTGKLHYMQASSGIDLWQDCVLVQPVRDTPPDDIWDGAAMIAAAPITDPAPDDSATFAALPTELARDKSYPIFQRQLSDHLYRTASLVLWACEPLEQFSKPGEKQEDFRNRLASQAGQRRDAERSKVTATYASKLSAADAEVAKQQAKASSEKWQFFAKLGSVAMVAADMVLRAKGMGSRGRPRSASTAFSQAAKEHGDQAIVQADLAKVLEDKERLEQAHDQALADIDAKYSANSLPLTQSEIKPRKGDITVDHVTLLWLPFRIDAAGKADAVYQLPPVPTPDP